LVAMTVDEAALHAWRSMKELRITMDEALALPMNNVSIPKSGSPGYRWRRRHGLDKGFRRAGGKPRWMICEFVPIPGTKEVTIAQYRAVITVPMRRLEC
jgi:hypothetical protein